MALIFAHLDADQVHAYSLVLASAGISHTIHSKDHRWAIDVAVWERQKAHRAVSLYLTENPQPASPETASANYVRSFSAIYAALILLAFHLAIRSDEHRRFLFETFGANAERILDGQVFRCLTALLLHSGWPHLLSNMAGTIVFGTVVASLFGWGVGWLLIVAAGIQGNFLAALWYGSHHLAVGASTAIFGAVGISAATTYWLRRKRQKDRLWTWAPLAGGLALVAWLGTSPNSDLVAHFTGFVSGILLGGIFCVWAKGRILPKPVQVLACAVIAVLVVAGWYWGR